MMAHYHRVPGSFLDDHIGRQNEKTMMISLHYHHILYIAKLVAGRSPGGTYVKDNPP